MNKLPPFSDNIGNGGFSVKKSLCDVQREIVYNKQVSLRPKE